MKRRDGFTLIELLMTITIMVILLGLSVVALRSSTANARDDKRRSDVQVIARGLERRYYDGNPRATATEIEKGSYPGTNEMLHASGSTIADFTPTQVVGGYLPDLLPGTTKDVFVSPTGGSFNLTCTSSCSPAGTMAAITTAVGSDNYSYEPIDRNGNVCANNSCVRFSIYYKTEVDNTIHSLSSKHQ
jgi:prepilin-type N-terminal cleavage/methylation domain-containing protein